MRPNVCTIIVNYRSAELATRATNAALRATVTYPDAPIYVIDNHSGDGSLAALQKAKSSLGWPERVTIWDSGKNGGYGFGNNVGIRLAMAAEPKPDFFYILNPDAFPDEDAIDVLVRYMDAHPEVGIAGSAARGIDGAKHFTAFRFPTIASEFETACRLGLVSRLLADRAVPLGDVVEDRIVDWVGGMAVMIRREVFERVGLFDEKYFLYFEETDLCRRAREAGFLTAYVPSSRVVHIGSATTGVKDTSQPLPRFWYDSRRRYFEKHHGRRYVLAADAARLVGELLFRARVAAFPVHDRPRKPHFVRDFVRHAAEQTWGWLRSA